jgi:hypothetical protein
MYMDKFNKEQFDQVYLTVRNIGEFSSVEKAVESARMAAAVDSMIGLKVAFVWKNRLGGMEFASRGIIATGIHGHLMLLGDGSVRASDSYKRTKLWYATDIGDVFVGLIRTGSPVVTIVQLFDKAVEDSDEALRLYENMRDSLIGSIEASDKIDGRI